MLTRLQKEQIFNEILNNVEELTYRRQVLDSLISQRAIAKMVSVKTTPAQMDRIKQTMLDLRLDFDDLKSRN